MDNSIPTVVTEVPAIEVPNKFEDLLDEPRIVFKSVSGTENRVNAKVIRRLKDKKTAMDRAREMLRNRLNGASNTPPVPQSTTTPSPFISVVNTSNRGNRPKPFSRLRTAKAQTSGTPTTISNLIQASTTLAPNNPASSTLSIRDKMVAARNRLRVLMGQKPIGLVTTPRPSAPTTPTPSTPTRMDISRQRIRENIHLAQEAEEAKIELLINNSTLSPIEANLADLPPDPQITVTAKSTIGDVNGIQDTINPLVLISPTFAPEEGAETTTRAPDSTTTPATTSKPTMKEMLNDITTLNSFDGVLDVPTRMQDTLLRLMQKKGLKRDPFAKLVTTAVTLIDTEEDIEDFTPPTPKQNPLLKNLRPNFNEDIDGLERPRNKQSNLLNQLKQNQDGIYEGLSTPNPRQSNLLKQLQSNRDSIYEGLSTPNPKQSNLLKQLRNGHNGVYEGLSTPNPKQSNLLKQLRNGHNGVYEGLSTPNPKQSNLLKQLRNGHNGVYEGLSTPRPNQSNLLKQLRGNQNGIYEGLSTPNPKQSNLFKQLRPNEDGVFEGLSTPSSRQNNLLGQLRANDEGLVKGLSTPSTRQDILLRQLQRGHNENLRLKVPPRFQKGRNERLQLKTPSRKQNPLLRKLKQDHNEQIQGLSEPSLKQNPLLRNLKGGQTNQNDNLKLPINPIDEPIFRSQRPFNRFNPDGLNTPRRRQNPLLRILRFDKRERILNKGLTPPRYRQNPLFRQLISTPQRYKNDFLQLPPKQQSKLLTILKRHGGDNFDADALLTAPRFKEELDVVELPLLDDEDDFEEYDSEDDEFSEDDYEEEDEEYDEEDEEYDEYEDEVPETPRRLRPIMPKSKFEILQIKRPVEEVTFQRVNEPLTTDDKKEGNL